MGACVSRFLRRFGPVVKRYGRKSAAARLWLVSYRPASINPGGARRETRVHATTAS